MKFTKLFIALMVAACIGLAGCDEGTDIDSSGAPEIAPGMNEMESEAEMPEDPGPEGEAEAEAEAEPAAEPAAEPEAEPEAEAEGEG